MGLIVVTITAVWPLGASVTSVANGHSTTSFPPVAAPGGLGMAYMTYSLTVRKAVTTAVLLCGNSRAPTLPSLCLTRLKTELSYPDLCQDYLSLFPLNVTSADSWPQTFGKEPFSDSSPLATASHLSSRLPSHHSSKRPPNSSWVQQGDSSHVWTGLKALPLICPSYLPSSRAFRASPHTCLVNKMAVS